MANELACLNCGMGFTPTRHITRQKFCSSECRVRYNNAKRYCTDTPVNECPECGTPIQQSGEAGRWRQCEKEEACVPMKKSTVPPALLPGSGIISASLLAQIMHSKYVLALPFYRQERELRRLGLPVSRQTMSNWVLTAGERWLLPVYHALHKELLANKILHADETTLMVLREPERQALADELGEDGIRELAQRYAEAYEGCYDGAELDAYIEEICADAYAGMDRLPEEKARIVQQAAQGRLEAQSAEKSGETRDPPEKYSIGEIEGEKGEYGTGVILDTDIFKGIRQKDWGKTLGAYVYENMAGAELTMFDEAGNPEVVYLARENDRVRKDGAKNSHKVLDKLAGYRGDTVRAKAIVQLDEVLGTSKFKETTNEHSHQWMDAHGWMIRTAYLQDENGNIYEATLNIANGKDRKILYEVNRVHQIDKIKSPGEHTVTDNGQRFRYQKPGTGGAQSETKNNINENAANVKERFPISEDARLAAEEAAKEPPTVYESLTMDSIPKKAQDYLRRVRGQTAAAIQQTLSMPFAARQEVLKPAIEEMMNEYLQTGRISQETVDRNFEESYRRGVKRPTVRVRWEFSDTP